jgi:hypothetical protein
VAQVIEELNVLRPEMTGIVNDEDLQKVARKHPRYLTFRITREHSDLKDKVINIQDSRRHIRLAQELTGRKYGLKLATVQTYWKKDKPPKYRVH